MLDARKGETELVLMELSYPKTLEEEEEEEEEEERERNVTEVRETS